MIDNTTNAILSAMEADIELKTTAIKTLSILDGIVHDDRLTKAQRLYILSEIENWAKTTEIAELIRKK